MGSRSINQGGQGVPGAASTSPQLWANNTQPQAGGMPAGFDPAFGVQPINAGGGRPAFPMQPAAPEQMPAMTQGPASLGKCPTCGK